MRGLFAHALIILQGLLRGHEKEMLHNVVVLNRAYTLRETLTHFWYYFLLLHTTIKTTWACLGRLNVIHKRRYRYYALMKKTLTKVYLYRQNNFESSTKIFRILFCYLKIVVMKLSCYFVILLCYEVLVIYK